MSLAIISPSGKFYGSEQTLFEFLSRTSGFDVYCKEESGGLYEILLENNFAHRYFKFNNLKYFYLRLCGLLLFRYKKVYVNEGGHSRYIKLLGRIFFWKRFFIHIRLVEDTENERIKNMPANVCLISTSEYIADLILRNTGQSSEVISSPTRAFKKNLKWNDDVRSKKILKIGVIGRVTPTKGINEAKQFLDFLRNFPDNRSFEFLFFGDVEQANKEVADFVHFCKNLNTINVTFKGFIKEKSRIFEEIDLVVHFNGREPLGVVFLEALNQGIPFFGINSGGIACIAEKLELSKYMVDGPNWQEQLLYNIGNFKIKDFKDARERMLMEYSPELYCNRLNTLFN